MTEADDSTDAGAQPDAAHDADLRTESDAEAMAAAEPGSPPRRSSIRLSLGLAAVVVAIDQITKRWALNALSDGQSRHVFGTLHWNLTFNSGMAFSRAQGIGPYIGAVAFIVVIAMVLSLRRSKGVGSSVAVGLVVGGAIGNLVDRLFRGDGWLRGSVVDFIDIGWWPIFNVADSGVSVGGVLILLSAIFESRSAGSRSAGSRSAGSKAAGSKASGSGASAG